jgi:opacity protein-like surface antigen
MKKRLCLAVLALTSNAYAYLSPEGPYISLMGSGSALKSLQVTLPDPFDPLHPVIPADYTYKFGGGAGLAAGYQYEQFKGEVELLFLTNSISHVNLLRAGGIERINTFPNDLNQRITGGTTLIGGFINGYLNLFSKDTDTTVAPYLGLGLGKGNVRTKVRFFQDDIELDTFRYELKQSATLGQFIIGANYLLDDYTSIGFDYRFITSSKLQNTDKRFQINTINIRLNYSF